MKEAMKRTLDESTGNSLMSKDEAELAKDLVESMKKLMGPSFKIGCVKEVEERPDTNKKLYDEDMVHHFGEHQKDNFFLDLADGCEFQEDDTPKTSHAWILDSLTFLEHCRKHNWEFGSRESARFASVAIIDKLEKVL